MVRRTAVGIFGAHPRGVGTLGWALRGAAAGAAGTTALNAVTYLDMAVRGRASSSTPEDTVRTLADKVGLEIAGDETARGNRVQGLGPLLGLATGVGVGVVVRATLDDLAR